MRPQRIEQAALEAEHRGARLGRAGLAERRQVEREQQLRQLQAARWEGVSVERRSRCTSHAPSRLAIGSATSAGVRKRAVPSASVPGR